MHAGTKGSLSSRGSFHGAPELPNACQGPPKQYENLINSMVLARLPFSPNAVVLVDPLAKLGPLFTQTGAQGSPWQGRPSAKMEAEATHGDSWGQAFTNLSTQSSAVDLHAQLNLRICYTWPRNWLHFFDFVQIGWHGFGQAGRLSSPIGQIFR